MEISKEKRKKNGKTTTTTLPVELIHRIQSLLPVKYAAQTSVLSKSWLRAWSTIPTLRFRETNYNDLIDGTLVRYKKANIPIESFDLQFKIRSQESASLVEKWIRFLAYKSSCLKELSLSICVLGIDAFTLPCEILFSSKNLNAINVSSYDTMITNSLCIRNNFVLNCVSLRVLELEDVDMSNDVVDKILSTCSLLEKIKLSTCRGLTTIKVKNLIYLRELILLLIEKNDVLEIDNIPSLRLFHYLTIFKRPLPFKMDSLRSVTKLHIHGVIIENAFLDIIKSKFPFLENLTLVIDPFSWGLEEYTLVLTSVSIKILDLSVWLKRSVGIQVYAINLLSFSYHGETRPKIVLVPTIAPEHINIRVL